MNTKKLFMLLAAVLLGSVSAMAQSGNNEPLKGDVNEDGTVDVADIVDVIKILKDAGGAVGEKMCYWYVGTNNGNAVTADNFTDVASRIPESEIPETGSVTANGQYVYFIMPETWHVGSITYANGSAVEFTCTDVMGYHIYKTSEMINTTINYTIKQITYYTYIGTDPTYKLVDENGDLKSDIATQIKSFSGVKTSTTKPTSVNDAYSADTTINGNGNYVYVIGLTSALNKTYYFKNAINANVNMENLGTFTIGSDEYTVLSSVQVCATVTIL